MKSTAAFLIVLFILLSGLSGITAREAEAQDRLTGELSVEIGDERNRMISIFNFTRSQYLLLAKAVEDLTTSEMELSEF